MKKLIAASSLAIASIAIPLSAAAEDLALILSNLDYRSQPDLTSGRSASQIERALQDAGFSTVTMQNQTLQNSLRRLESVARRIAAADRLVVVVNGHVARDGDRAWMLVPEARTPTDLTIGTMAFPLAPLVDAAATKPGAAVIAVLDQQRNATLGRGLQTGFPADAAPQGVTVVSGPGNRLAELFGGALMERGRPVADAVASVADVRSAGFVPRLYSFLPADEFVLTDDVTVVEVPPPSREEQLAQTEADLALGRDERRRIQQNLAVLGFNPGGIDGLIGPGSRRAIRAWQGDRGFEASGYLDRPQLQALRLQAEARAAQLEQEARQRQQQEDARDTAYWRDTGQGSDEAGMRAYLDRYPDGLFSDIANNRLAEIEEARRPQVPQAELLDWEAAQAEDTVDGYQAYMDNYPDGAFIDAADQRMKDLISEEESADVVRAYEEEERRVAGNSVARRLVENRLTSLGLEPGRNDGNFDEDTRKALRRFQKARGLEVTGYVNQETMVRILLGG